MGANVVLFLLKNDNIRNKHMNSVIKMLR